MGVRYADIFFDLIGRDQTRWSPGIGHHET
jgi:hypothetical protein